MEIEIGFNKKSFDYEYRKKHILLLNCRRCGCIYVLLHEDKFLSNWNVSIGRNFFSDGYNFIFNFLVFFLTFWYSMSIVLSWFIIKSTPIFLKKTNPGDVQLHRKCRGVTRTARVLKIYEPMLVYILLSIIGAFVFFADFKSNRIDIYFFTLSIGLTSLCIISVLGVYSDKRVNKENKSKTVISIIVMTLFLFSSLSDMLPILSDVSMNLIGIRKSNITVVIKGSDLDMARILSGNQDQSYFSGDALFTGVGNTSLLIINHKRIVVRNENLSLSY